MGLECELKYLDVDLDTLSVRLEQFRQVFRVKHRI